MGKAEQAWKERATDVAAKPSSYLLGISDYKASLKAAIEKEKVSRGISGHYADGRTWAFEKVLELLENVTPKVD